MASLLLTISNRIINVPRNLPGLRIRIWSSFTRKGLWWKAFWGLYHRTYWENTVGGEQRETKNSCYKSYFEYASRYFISKQNDITGKMSVCQKTFPRSIFHINTYWKCPKLYWNDTNTTRRHSWIDFHLGLNLPVVSSQHLFQFFFLASVPFYAKVLAVNIAVIICQGTYLFAK